MAKLPRRQRRLGVGSQRRARLLTGGEDPPLVKEHPEDSTGVPLGYMPPKRRKPFAPVADSPEEKSAAGRKRGKQPPERVRSALAVQADKAAEGVLSSGQPVWLPAMTTTEQSIVEERLRRRADVGYRSNVPLGGGEEPPERCVVVFPL